MAAGETPASPYPSALLTIPKHNNKRNVAFTPVRLPHTKMSCSSLDCFVISPPDAEDLGPEYRLYKTTPKTVLAIAKSSSMRSEVEESRLTEKVGDEGRVLRGGYMAESDDEDEGAAAGGFTHGNAGFMIWPSAEEERIRKVGRRSRARH